MRFADRCDAGRRLAVLLDDYANCPDVVVLGLLRGGVVVAAEVAHALHAPLDVISVKKIGAPTQPELALGAVAAGDICIWNDTLLHMIGITASDLQGERMKAEEALRQGEDSYRRNNGQLPLTNRITLLVDDGIATGATMRAAIASARVRGSARVVVAVPVAAAATCAALHAEADDVVCALCPRSFESVGEEYQYFPQVPDESVFALVSRTNGNGNAVQ